MSLLDTIDGSFMNFAYGWAFSKPVRKVYYNITITGLSVAVALGHRHDRARRACSPATSVDITRSATSSSACSSSTWAVALAVWHFGRIEERWSAEIEPRRP